MQITITSPIGTQWLSKSQGWTRDEMQRIGRVRSYYRIGRLLIWWRWHRRTRKPRR